ncbi:MAG: plastocyanin/azurin family copper-binding protein [Chloroflexota bacterium]|nr:plastocyanin/azurin family copper-binding protein [Chloroflexota bacterium]
MKLSGVMLAVGAAVLVGSTVACGGGTSNADKTSTAVAKPAGNATAATTKQASTSSAGGAQKQLTITAMDFSFSAPELSVSKGDTIAITFKNGGSATHTLTFYSDAEHTKAIPGADTGSVSGGATKTLSVTADKGLYYRCNIHPTQMMGEIEIQ